jgi:hypothetical protein
VTQETNAEPHADRGTIRQASDAWSDGTRAISEDVAIDIVWRDLGIEARPA